MIITVTLTWVKGQSHAKSVHRVRSSNEKVNLIICTKETPKADFLASCVAETSYGYNAKSIILKEAPEAILWANFEVDLNLAPKGFCYPQISIINLLRRQFFTW